MGIGSPVPHSQEAQAMSSTPVVLETDLPGLNLIARGKVRDIYDLDDKLLIVTSDRLSAFDVVNPIGIPEKGRVLTALSVFWFKLIADIIDTHFITDQVAEMGHGLEAHAADRLAARDTVRAQLVRGLGGAWISAWWRGDRLHGLGFGGRG